MKTRQRFTLGLALLGTLLSFGLLAYAGQLLFDGVPVDITTATNESLVIAPGEGGITQIGDKTGATKDVATSNDDLLITNNLEVEGKSRIEGALTVNGAASLNGAVTLGDASGDDITVTGRIASSAIPKTDSTYDLGSSSLAWQTLYVDTIKSTDGTELALSPDSGEGIDLTVTRSAATGNETLFDLSGTVNKATSGNYTGLLLNVTETAAPGSLDRLLDLQVGGTRQLQVFNGIASTANYGLLSVGAGAFDGSTSGFFAGSSSGTLIAGNTASGFAGNLIDLQIAGSSKFKIDADGNLTIAGTGGGDSIQVAGTAATDANLTEGLAIDLTLDTSASPDTVTLAYDPTELTGSRTWGDASTDTIVWTWDRATGTDPTLTFGSGSLTTNSNLIFSDAQKIIGGTATTADLSLQTTSGVGASGADMHFLLGNNGATEAMTILNDGSVGIGTTSPVARLHVPVAPTGSANFGLVSLGSGPWDGTTAGFFAGSASGTVLAANAASGYGGNLLDLQVAGSSKFKVDSTGALTLGGTLGVASGGTGAATFTANGVLYGNTTSAIQVTAQGGANTILIANAGAPSFSASPTIGTSVTVPTVIGGTAASSTLALRSTSGVGTSDALLFQVGNNGATEAMRITTAGNVGIGTTSPGAKLHILTPDSSTNPDIILQAFAASPLLRGRAARGTSGSPTIILNNDEPLTLDAFGYDGAAYIAAARIGLQIDGTPGASDMPGRIVFSTTADGAAAVTERMRITQAGNVGIGETVPGSKLSVSGGASIGAGYDTTAAPSDGLIVEGEVRIGTTSNPSTGHKLRISAGSGKNLSIGPNVDLADGVAFSALNDDNSANTGLELRGSPIKLTGTVGIGTTNPGETLHVVGSTHFSRASFPPVKVNRDTNDGTLISFLQDAIEEGTISVSGTTVSYNAFTGSHYAWTEERIERGMLVSMAGVHRRLNDNPASEPVYGITTTRQANDPSVLGAYLSLQEPSKSASATNPHLVMAVGNGEMWVVDMGENLDAGDDLISTSVPGHAMKEDGTYSPAYVIARVAEPVDWSTVTETVDDHGTPRKHKKISVLFESFVKTNQHEIEELKAENAQLKERLAELEQLETTVAALQAKVNGLLPETARKDDR